MFDSIAKGIQEGSLYTIKCSYLEIYNEGINDILTNPVVAGLKIREFPGLGMQVIGMYEKFISS
jgi:hypothetical protein